MEILFKTAGIVSQIDLLRYMYYVACASHATDTNVAAYASYHRETPMERQNGRLPKWQTFMPNRQTAKMADRQTVVWEFKFENSHIGTFLHRTFEFGTSVSNLKIRI